MITLRPAQVQIDKCAAARGTDTDADTDGQIYMYTDTDADTGNPLCHHFLPPFLVGKYICTYAPLGT